MLNVGRFLHRFPGIATLMLSAIIVAGGRSQRMGFDKLFTPLERKPVVAHSIAAFEQTESVSDIILVGPTERSLQYETIARTHGFRKVSVVIPGGARRQDSVAASAWTNSAPRPTSSPSMTPPVRSSRRI